MITVRIAGWGKTKIVREAIAPKSNWGDPDFLRDLWDGIRAGTSLVGLSKQLKVPDIETGAPTEINPKTLKGQVGKPALWRRMDELGRQGHLQEYDINPEGLPEGQSPARFLYRQMASRRAAPSGVSSGGGGGGPINLTQDDFLFAESLLDGIGDHPGKTINQIGEEVAERIGRPGSGSSVSKRLKKEWAGREEIQQKSKRNRANQARRQLTLRQENDPKAGQATFLEMGMEGREQTRKPLPRGRPPASRTNPQEGLLPTNTRRLVLDLEKNHKEIVGKADEIARSDPSLSDRDIAEQMSLNHKKLRRYISYWRKNAGVPIPRALELAISGGAPEREPLSLETTDVPRAGAADPLDIDPAYRELMASKNMRIRVFGF
jgi:hypothetical protein